jgi:TolB protein
MKNLLLLFLVACVTQNAAAQTDIYIRGSGKLFPIALPQLCAQTETSAANREIPRVIARDLDLSGYFEVLNPEAYVEAPGKCAGPDGFAYSDWSVIGAEGLVRGVVSAASDGTVRVQLYLHDVQKQRVVLGKEYTGDESQVPRMAHRFANEIMKFFTGEPGVFGTQIAFTSRVGRFKELFVMDMDGSNVRQLTNDKSLALSPSWSRDANSLFYTSYRKRVPDLFTIALGSRRISQLTSGPEMELGPRFSHDGSKMIASVSQGQDSDIVLLNSQGRIVRKLTSSNGAIDVSPDWSADDSSVVFCSNRAGGPQIYVMDASGSNAHRISFVSSNYCTSPRWSPKGDKIAFVCRADSGFQIFVVDPSGSNALQLTSLGDNEDPDWSPNGRYLVFSTTFGKHQGYVLGLMRNDGSSMKQLTTSRGGDFQPNWGPLLP